MTESNFNISNSKIQRALFASSKSVELSLQRLSSGMKINNAGDDCAGLSLTTKLNSDIRCFGVAKTNIQTGINYLQSGAGAIDNILQSLQRIRDLSLQSANGVYSVSERASMQKEVDVHTQEISQIKESTKFSDKKIFGDSQKFIKPVEQMSKKDAEAAGYITISSAEEFVNLISTDGSNTAGKTFILMNDIDMSAYEGHTKGYFAGTFDGNGYAIKNVSLNSESLQNFGVFSTTNSGSIIKNLGVENCNITGTAKLGALVATSNSTISNCYSTGTINGKWNYIGGLAGKVESGSITDSYSTVNVSSEGKITGGLAGSSKVAISNCYASGNITGKDRVGGISGELIGGIITNSSFCGNITGNASIGGIVGLVSGNKAAVIDNSFVSGCIKGSSQVGGLLGNASDAGVTTIKNSYMKGSVFATSQVGGLGGIIGNNVNISYCYSSAKVIGTITSGGLIGENSGNLSNSYWDKELSSQEIGCAVTTTIPYHTIGLTSQEMKDPSNFAGWDTNVWNFSEGTPTLVFAASKATPPPPPKIALIQRFWYKSESKIMMNQ